MITDIVDPLTGGTISIVEFNKMYENTLKHINIQDFIEIDKIMSFRYVFHENCISRFITLAIKYKSIPPLSQIYQGL
jgi:hypothetical protein